MEGDFTPRQPNTCIEKYNSTAVLPENKTGLLKRNIKFFGAANVGWVNNGKLDVHNGKTSTPHYERPDAIYNFKVGKTYTLTITGRSSGFHIYRILLVDINKYNTRNVNNMSGNTAESICE